MGDTAMRSCVVFLALVAAVAVTVVIGDEASTAEKVRAMSRQELEEAFKNTRHEAAESKKALDKAHDKITALTDELDAVTDNDEFEHNRRTNERDMKAKAKKKEAKKETKQLKKVTKFSDMVMEHAAEFLAMAAAKKWANKGSKVQKLAVLEAARAGGRAGAVQPLKKVVRDAAIAAVKASRKAQKAKGVSGKHKIRKVAVKAAHDAVNKILKEQDELVEKAAQKFYKAALKKYPPSVFLAEDDDKPNNFKAPPGIHLSLGGAPEAIPEKQVGASKKAKKVAKKAPKKAAPKKAANVDAVVPETTQKK